jgi:hypothetical protein
MKRLLFAVAVAVVAASGLVVPTVGQTAGPIVVLGSLHSPRGLSFGPGGHLFVAQAGDATTSGSIIEILNPMSKNPNVRTLVDGLASIGDEGEFVGVDGISVLDRGTNSAVYGIMAIAPEVTGDARFGVLFKVNMRGEVQNLANVGSANYQWTTDHSDLWEEFPDVNPYGVLALPGHTYVADAGANTLNEVLADGTVTVLAYFPNEAIRDAVPTCIAKGPDGALYVGTLALVDSLVLGPSAKVYRVDPSEADPNDLGTILNVATEWASGLWPINGCTFGADGNFYASQLLTNPDFGDPRGDVVRILYAAPWVHTWLTGGALSFAGGVAVGPNGAVYVADGTAFVPEGRIVRLP